MSSNLILFSNPAKDKGDAAVTEMLRKVNGRGTHRVIALRSPIRCILSTKGSLIHRQRVNHSTMDFTRNIHRSLHRSPSIVTMKRVQSERAVTTTLATTRAKRLILKALRGKHTLRTINHVIRMFPTRRRDRIHLVVSSILHYISTREL